MQNIPETIRWLEEGGFIERTADDRYELTDLGVYIGLLLQREELLPEAWPADE
jgi:predicted transcriptional regulator